ncbi:MAG: aconitate hydratase AcnA [SAR86 cluster bacterium]|uniref:Aconitate hydratase n=1 Tax=SAR86 cluster bacterium TaxID=2030880 RepID=A0A2A4X206_9GAMM|nr:MAG: aconitate hydratase AcnA [SAR86 cluster bacterium]
MNNPREQSIRELSVGSTTYKYFSLEALCEAGFDNVDSLPISIKILLENLLRHCDEKVVTRTHIEKLVDWQNSQHSSEEIMFLPVRVLMQDFTGVPAVVDLAAMRDAVARGGKDPSLINPTNSVDLVIDHSVMVDKFAVESAYRENVKIEMERNRERYQFLRWGQTAFDNFRVVPPGTGICHQVNLEYLAKSVWQAEIGGDLFAFPDTLVGTDSHTTMINGLAVLGWGVGGIEAEAAMLGQPLSMNIPQVVGFKLEGDLVEGITATDLVLTITEMLRGHGVVGKFVEFYGAGLNNLSLADRATIANMTPEYGATCSFFAVDQKTLDYLALTGRETQNIELVEAYSKAQGLWRRDDDAVNYSSSLSLDMSEVVPCLAGPKRPQDRVPVTDLAGCFTKEFDISVAKSGAVEGEDYELEEGAVVIAAITSCTNTSNPDVMMAAGLMAKKALEKGLQRKPWVKTSLAPGSKVVSEYLEQAGLQEPLDKLGFNLVGYGCTTCIGNSGPLPPAIDAAIADNDLTVCSVLSGNRNFEGRIHQRVKANWLASPPLVVAYALAGSVNVDISTEPLGENAAGESIYLNDIWPSNEEIDEAVKLVRRQMFDKGYSEVFDGDEEWNSLPIEPGKTYQWQEDSTYIRNPPFFDPAITDVSGDILSANILAVLGDSVTTDHISPAGSIAEDSPAGDYLKSRGIEKAQFNSYGSRRGNHEVMMRGTFANIRIKNEMLAGIEGGYTHMAGETKAMPIYDAAMQYERNKTPLVVVAGKEYGTGSSRDWAAKGTRLLGVRAVIAQSFERIHRSNLAGMGVLPLQFPDGVDRKSLKLSGNEEISLTGLTNVSAGMKVSMEVEYVDGSIDSCELLCRLDTELEVQYFNSGGIMPFVVNKLLAD